VVESEAPNKACSGRRGFCAIYEHFPGFEFLLIPSAIHTRPPSAANANRWAANQDFSILKPRLYFRAILQHCSKELI
jgi:hypothetical protein